jgi:hypothetical protein
MSLFADIGGIDPALPQLVSRAFQALGIDDPGGPLPIAPQSFILIDRHRRFVDLVIA